MKIHLDIQNIFSNGLHAVKKNIINSLIFTRFRVSILKKPIKLWFFREDDFLNFGDEITTDIIERVFHKKYVRTKIEEAELFATGSIIGVISNTKKNKKSYVWGSGFIEEGGSITNEKLIFKAVRGYYSRNRLPKRYCTIAVGDPGLLSNLMYKRIDEKTDIIGIIPHYVDSSNAVLERAKKDPRYKIISVKDTPESVAKQITQCKIILSSSLHGLIVADSFGIPNIHMPISNRVVGGNYKFKDYYSSINKDYKKFNKQDLYDSHKIKRATESYKPIENLEEIQKNLIKSFPL